MFYLTSFEVFLICNPCTLFWDAKTLEPLKGGGRRGHVPSKIYAPHVFIFWGTFYLVLWHFKLEIDFQLIKRTPQNVSSEKGKKTGSQNKSRILGSLKMHYFTPNFQKNSWGETPDPEFDKLKKKKWINSFLSSTNIKLAQNCYDNIWSH